MDTGLTGRRAIVCAASKGLGRASALALAREGARVVICARTHDALASTASDIRAATGSDVIPIVADVSRADDVQRLIAAAVDAFGGLDVLVTNTGGPPSAAFERVTDAEWGAAVESMLFSVVRLCRGVIPLMRSAGGGRIINITSVSVKQPVDGLVLSNSVRAAVTGLSRTLANELAPAGITVNCVAPGYTATDRVIELARAAAEREGSTPEAVQARTEALVPMQRLGTPEEFGDAVAFLASARASYITGITLTVDGGYVKGLL